MNKVRRIENYKKKKNDNNRNKKGRVNFPTSKHSKQNEAIFTIGVSDI